jgi:hypothetical protein
MTARFSWNQQNARGHSLRLRATALALRRPRLQKTLVVVMVVIMIAVVLVLVPIIPISIFVPIVIVLHAPMLAFPVPVIEFPALITRREPMGARIRCSRPIALMPLPVAPYRVPIAINPRVVRSWTSWKNSNHRGRRRRTDPYTKGNLTGKNGCSNQTGRRKQ